MAGKLRIGHLSTFYHTAMVLMAKAELLGGLGREVEWRLFGTGPAIVNAFEKGELDLAYIGLPPAIIGIARGVDVVCVAGGHVEGTVISAKGHYRGHPETEDLREILRQFCGLRIGVPGKGSIHDVILTDCLETSGLRDEIEVVNFEWADQVLEAVVRNEVAAAFGTPALAVAVKRYTDGKVLYPPSKLWPNNPSYGILMKRTFLRQEREAAEQFLLAHEEATSLLRNRPAEAAKTISEYIGIVDEEFVLETLSLSPRYCAKLTDSYIVSTMAFVKALKNLGYISREIAPDEIFDTSLIDKIHPEKDHYREWHG